MPKEDPLPEDWLERLVVRLFKAKGDVQDYGNYRKIKIMNFMRKLWERVMNCHIQAVTNIMANQLGFMPGKSTMEPNSSSL